MIIELFVVWVCVCVCHGRGKVCYLRCQLPEALVVYTEAAGLAKDQREIEHIALYEKGKWNYCITVSDVKRHRCVVTTMVYRATKK